MTEGVELMEVHIEQKLHMMLYSGSKKCPNVCMIWKDQLAVIC